jgi:hypothetical protein
MHPSRIRLSVPPHTHLFHCVSPFCLMALLAQGIALFSPASSAQNAIQIPGNPVSEVVPREVLVGVRPAQDDAQEATRLNAIGGTVAGRQPNLHSYRIRLHFAESYFSTAGQRFFNVAINGATVLANFDIATVAGGVNKALVEQFTTNADGSGNINITFTWQTNWPLVNAVEILH